ncbi:DNA polymerase III subunit gamma/tau [Caulobacter sp. SLTY]|uniref:DNA polymerase III subunit gamma/tau n=1 Tax=Caulobacter sp. SLTY TaxID=2683262 RepID=UPI001411B48A|nr:DNA polymerase III subunit gamma/tau [Caulobacter sp. SLTY]NBB16368.1 DNA polymerase III subunit gamma/tau [Caulobacter sp. SLTY]
MSDTAPPWDEDEPRDEAPERDPDTVDIFGDPDPSPQPAMPEPPPPAPDLAEMPAYTVLARKYRPRTFEDLIGQEAMVRTLTNAFATGRIAHAFMLTGVRGVGKTTTARLLAQALNYESDTVHQPSMDLSVDGVHSAAIREGRHMDVLELDAASRTKVDEMRELLDGVRYSPVEARYKVYVIDEVHMLSTAAFNALLKTLEEPPPHAKFIFATTEIRKVPVTILSRCQRFDLRRVEPDVLARHFERICEKEGAKVEAEGLALISRAAEGSVRDGLSLLDQAIVQTEPGQVVPTKIVQDMLGLADRSQTIELFEQVMRGETGAAIHTFRTLWGFGADPVQVVLDLLEHSHQAAVSKALGPDALTLPKEQAQRIAAVGALASAGSLSRLWQMLLKAHDEVRRAPDPSAAVEMALIRLTYAADLPGPEEALKALRDGEPIGGGPSGGGGQVAAGGGAVAQARFAQPVMQAAPQAETVTLASFDDVLALIEKKRDMRLKLDVDGYVRLVSFRPGAIVFEPAPGTPKDLAQRLVARLKEWTGQPWLVAAEGGGGAETAWERQKREQREARAEIEADPFVRSVLDAFPGAEILAVKSLAIPQGEAASDPPVEPDDED